MRYVLPGKRLLFPVVALLSVNCGKTLVVRAPSAAPAAHAGKSSAGNPEIILFEVEPSVVERGQEVVLRWKVNNAETVEINPGGDAISPAGTRIVRPDASTSYRLTVKRKETIQSAAVTVNVISPLLISSGDRNRSISRRELTQQAELADVYFGFDHGDLPAEAGAILKREAEMLTAILKASPDVRVHLEGHCDDRD
jgi:hypothetical protein